MAKSTKNPYGISIPGPTKIKGGASTIITPGTNFGNAGPAAGSPKKSDDKSRK